MTNEKTTRIQKGRLQKKRTIPINYIDEVFCYDVENPNHR